MWPATKADRRRVLAAGTIAGIAALVAVALGRRAPRLYRLGLVAPFEGLFRNDGYDALSVCRAAVSDWNAAARPLGLQLQVWAVDDGNDPIQSVTRARELVGDPLVVAVVGHATPECGAASAPIYAEAGLLQVSPITLPRGTSGDSPTAVSVGPAPSQVARIVSDTEPDMQVQEANLGLLSLALQLGSAPRPERMLLANGYCSAPLVQSFPDVEFSAVCRSSAASLPELVSLAASRTLAAVSEAARYHGQLTRQAVLEACLSAARKDGWVADGSAWYEPGSAITVARCRRQPNA